MKPYCFVLMPFGEKPDDNGNLINFDKIYEDIIVPAIKKAKMEPIRADEEIIGGIIQKPMFERLMLCDYAIADLTTANPNVLYELGVRHGIRPYSTVLTFSYGTRLPFDVMPFDVMPLRAIQYKTNSSGEPKEAEKDQEKIAEQLNACRNQEIDSPLYQLVSDMPAIDISHLKTDRFREVVEYCEEIKRRLKLARKQGSSAIKEIEQELSINDADLALVLDIFLSYREVEDHQAMVELVSKMSPELANSIMVREQYGFALNRLEHHEEAEEVILNIIKKRGSSSETYGILGRVYKDLWEKALNESSSAKAKGFLSKAIETYLKGFESDWRDAYPGINAVTLMEMKDEDDDRKKEILPVVRYAAKRRLNSSSCNYWDYATLLELSIIDNDKDSAENWLGETLANIREPWEPKTTARNLKFIKDARYNRGETIDWINKIVEELENAR